MIKDVRIQRQQRYEVFIRILGVAHHDWEKIAEIKSPGLSELLRPAFEQVYPLHYFKIVIAKAGTFDTEKEQ